MGVKLSHRLHQDRFASVYQEAILGVLVAAETISQNMDEICSIHGITLQQYNVLRILRGVHPEGHPRCDISQRMIQRAPDVTRLINRLVEQGYARRERSEFDGRLSLTCITQKGLDLLEVLQPAIAKVERDVSAALTKEQAKQLAALCDLIIQP